MWRRVTTLGPAELEDGTQRSSAPRAALSRKAVPIGAASGQAAGRESTYKSFVALELATALMTSQPFLGGIIKRQCGVLFLAAEGADEMRLRLNAAVREKCGNMPRAQPGASQRAAMNSARMSRARLQ